MESWGFLTNHARVLLCIAQDPGARLRDIAASLSITERSAHGIVTDLAEAGYVIRQKDGRRNRYRIQAHLPVPEPGTREPAIGEVVALFAARARPPPDGHRIEVYWEPGTRAGDRAAGRAARRPGQLARAQRARRVGDCRTAQRSSW